MLLSKGFVQFLLVADMLIERGRDDGSFRTDIPTKVLCSAMLGCAEGMMRDRVLSVRNHEPDVFDEEVVLRTFTAMVNGLAAAPAPRE